MPKYLAALTIFLLLGMVMVCVYLLKRKGIEAMNFGKIDRTDFIIPPFALFYFYLIFAHTFNLPTISRQVFFQSDVVAWVGVALFSVGLAILLWSMVSFGQSFRVGIDTSHPDKLVTTGVFGISRNPIYVAFSLVMLGQFLVFPNWILLVYLLAAFWLFNRQVLREEDYLRMHYGKDYLDYCSKVGRYI